MENYQDLKRLTWMALAMLATLSCGSRLNVVTDWNTIASTTIVKNGGKASTPSGVWFAYTSLAVYAAVNAITGQYRTFYYQGAGPRTVSVEAAAAGAAHGILVNYFPGQSDLDARLAATLSNVSADQGAKDAGVSAGEAAAAAVIAARGGDGLEANVPYVLGAGSGAWIPTPPGYLPPLTVAGPGLHADETWVKLRTGKGYVWVFTSLEEVVLMYKATREAEFVPRMLKEFHRVLVSDFYVAYDSLECPQQKCLIHLIRDMNQDLLNNPYDEELQSITQPFGALLRSIVQTVDEHGLKRRYLQRHSGDVAEFFRVLSTRSFRSEAAQALQRRIIKYQEKLLTFIRHDSVPWKQQQRRECDQTVRLLPRKHRRYAEGNGAE